MRKDQSQINNPYRKSMHGLRRTVVLVGLFSAAINILMLTGPLYMLQVYDRVLSSGSVATLQGLFVIVVILYTFLGIYELLRTRLLSRASYRLDTQIGGPAFSSWLDMGIVDGQSRYYPVRDLEVVRSFMASPAILGLFDLPWIPIFLAVVFFIHPWLGWLTVAGAAVVAIVALLNQFVTQRVVAGAMSNDSDERSFVERSHRNAEVIVSLGMKGMITDRWKKMHQQNLAHNQRAVEWSEVFTSFSKAFRLLLQSTLLTVGAYLALAQEISPGMIIAGSIIAGRALAPVDQVIGQWRSIGRAKEAHRRLLLAFDSLPAEKPRVDLPQPTGRLKVINLTKMTPDNSSISDRARILDRVSFEVGPGDGLAVIGDSAAGKSSLARLLVGAWQPDAGEIRLDGATLDQWKPADLGRYIGYLPQTVEMLPGTIAENIARFDPEAKDQDVIEAAKIAGVHDMILGMPDGYATYIGISAQPLSGGQNQRLGLARALYGQPKFVVLDEPNSNLDTIGDEALVVAVNTLRRRGAAVIIMSHRPNVISSVNHILALHKGRVAKFGEKSDMVANTSDVTSQVDVLAARKSRL